MAVTRSQTVTAKKNSIKKNRPKIILRLGKGHTPSRKSPTTSPEVVRRASSHLVYESRKCASNLRSPIRKANVRRRNVIKNPDYVHDCSYPRKPRVKFRMPQKATGQPEPAKTKIEHAMKRSCPDLKALPEPLKKKQCRDSTSFPSRAWGEREEVGLSRIGRADKEIEIWEEVYRNHERNMPDLLPVVAESLLKAKRARAALDDTLEENTRIGLPDPGAIAIEKRLQALEWGLSTSRFEPERQNIRGAIAAYKSGAITYSDQYHLFWAGQLVGKAACYSDFVRDRNKRLDGYAALYGAHWLWWEPPLDVHPEEHPKAKPAVGLYRRENHTDFGNYRVHQGFWKRTGWVARMPRPSRTTQVRANSNSKSEVDCGPDGPQLAFRTLLDSGATFPCLHAEDFVRLGIDRKAYACQSIAEIETAGGPQVSRLYEMFVCVVDDNGKQLVDPTDPVVSTGPLYLGSLCPVLESVNPLTVDANGREKSQRLSGILPFMACYISSAPTRGILWLGEDRNDVLGHHKMPGQKKWDIDTGNTLQKQANPLLPDDRFDNPKVKFTHRGGRIIDEDDELEKNVSNVTILKGTPLEHLQRTYADMDYLRDKASS